MLHYLVVWSLIPELQSEYELTFFEGETVMSHIFSNTFEEAVEKAEEIREKLNDISISINTLKNIEVPKVFDDQLLKQNKGTLTSYGFWGFEEHYVTIIKVF